MELTYLTIILAIVSLWHKKLPNLWGYLLGLALLVGVYREVVQIEGVLYTVVYIVTAILAIRRKFSINGYELSTEAKPIIHSAFIVIFVVLTLLLLHHSVPFYEPWILYSDIVLHENSPATGMSIKLDNAVVGVVIIALATTRASTLQQWKTLLYKSLPYNVGTVAILISIAVYFNFLQFSFVESNYIVPTLISFLFFTCLAEEAFFRVYVQGNL
ncbi:MAG: hypothetical protein OEZ58_14770, partial [Gammaproteobacteria bacterium]|nr:hypothetical protein [Gammaproteobacteria bacterium]